ncbi:FAD-dependent oxidoreductase [Legionella sp. WA2024007413]
MDSISLWEKISKRQVDYPELTEDIEVDVAIIGGGITGVTAAEQLTKAGKKVALVEAEKIGGITTSLSTGNLYIAVQPLYQTIASKFDFDTAKSVALSRKFAIEYIEKKVSDKKIHCKFTRRPWYAYTVKNEQATIEKEFELLKKMDLSVEYTKTLPFDFKFSKAIVMKDQARFNPLQYVLSMAADLLKNGCLIFEKTRVTKVTEHNHCVLETEKAKIKAKNVFMATHTPIGINPTQLFTAPYRSYVMGIELENKEYPEGHVWDLDSPFHSICTHSVSLKRPQIMLVAGEHHKTGQNPSKTSSYKKLEKYINSTFKVSKTVYKWSAQHFQSADSIPYIGLASGSSKHTYMATGYWADGLIYGTLAGIIISDLILKNSNPLEPIYQSTRHNLLSSAAFLWKENSNVLRQYLEDYPTLFSQKTENIKRGEGKVIEYNDEKLAVSRDTENNLHALSAVCPHMKCIVAWNNEEQTWDCPCHGSRFTCDGKVIEGPATTDLEIKQWK